VRDQGGRTYGSQSVVSEGQQVSMDLAFIIIIINSTHAIPSQPNLLYPRRNDHQDASSYALHSFSPSTFKHQQ